jgi:steroid 5-alpha reductase family enzyme
MTTGLPDVRDWPLLGRQNLSNAALVLLVPLPAVLAANTLFHWFPAHAIPPDPGLDGATTPSGAAAWLLHHPVWAANLFYFVFVDLVFFAIALLQRSSWLIDPYWTLLPIGLAGFYLAHPQAQPDWNRVALSWTALLVWSVRLTANYFRRERWRFGLREDWRYAKMRAERPGFWWEQLFVVQLAQHLMLVGLSLPFWAVAFRNPPVGPLDVLCFAGALAGVGVAHAADGQLDRFMRENEARVHRGEPRVRLLETGLWRYSRHPNYFGEQLFWWSIAGFGVAVGEPWVVIGTAFNSCVLAGVTVMTERRMLQVPERRAAYEAYRRRTSVWVPWRVGPG